MTDEPKPALPNLNLLGLAQPISQKVQIRQVRLWDTAIARDSVGDDDLPAHNNHGFDVRYTRDSDTQLSVRVTFVCGASHEGDQSKSEPALRIQAQFEITYDAPGLNENSDEQLLAFAKMNGTFNAWPYWREYLQSVSQRMGLPALTIPSLTVGSLLAAYITHDVKKVAQSQTK